MEYEILIPLEEDNTYLALETRYQLGGTNYFNGNSEKRGIYLNFTKQTKIQRDGYISTQTTIFEKGNYKIFIQELTRKSEKRVKEFHQYVDSIKDELYKAWKDNDINEIFRLIKLYTK
jgi:hypothetical protein